MEYNFKEIEANWKKYWNEQQVYKVNNQSDRPKCYVLDMFPYPSGAGLHVGHPLGYIASDIYARYKRLKGFNVLHPMGFDAFGLPAEQYAIETGQHPAVTTEKNIARYREQLDNIGFCYDWSREVRTSDPKYYKWTQWIFLQLFHSWYDRSANKAKPIAELVVVFEKEGNTSIPCPGDETLHFDAVTWNNYSEKQQRDSLMQYRLAYQGFAQVWWCEALGTVLANDEVVNGVSERGGHPVERKNMRQWFLRITEYAERLLTSLDTLDWTDAMKEMQRNWIGKSVGAEVRFSLTPALSKGEGAANQKSEQLNQDASGDLTPALSRGEGAANQKSEQLNQDASGDLSPALSGGEGAANQKSEQLNQDASGDLTPALSRGEGAANQKSEQLNQDASGDLTPALSRGEGAANQKSEQLNQDASGDLTPALSRGEGAANQNTKAVQQENVVKAGVQGWNTANPDVYKMVAPFRKELKDNLTEAENKLWQELRDNRLGAKFRRQHVVGRFIADFICLQHNLIIEVDGKIHEQQKIEDANRTVYLQERGFRVIRYTNEEIMKNISSVLAKIKQHLLSPAGSPQIDNVAGNDTLSSGEGRGEVSNGINANLSENDSLSPGEGRGEVISVFTTRPDTIFGVDFLVLAPEHELVDAITAEQQKNAINEYKTYVKSRSERERMSEVKQVTGCFTGGYARHPLTNREIPIWISEYVLVGYGTGAIMAVPSGDERDHAFAKHFNIPITNIFGDKYTGEEAYSTKTGIIENSDFLSGMTIADATEVAIEELVDEGAGKRKVNYRLRDAGFSRQRYWGEPFPIMYVDDIPYGTDEPIIHNDWQLGTLPVELPHVESYRPGPEGQGPLANIEDWVTTEAGQRETNTMPGYAGSSWYFLRYMDPHNDTEFADRKATDYWNQVDIYIGGTEHAVGHLLYSRMWTKALCDLGHIGFDEPFKKLLNQGMIQGSSRLIYRLNLQAAEKIVSRVLIKELSHLNFKKETILKEDFRYDFVSEDKKILIEIGSQKGVKHRFKAAQEKCKDCFLLLFISYEEILGKLNKGVNEIEDFLTKIINTNEHYCSPNTLRNNFFISKGTLERLVDKGYLSENNVNRLNVDITLVNGSELNEDSLKLWRPDFSKAKFIRENDGRFICIAEVEKMSKSKYNVVNPDICVSNYGSDTFRMYEMFLGPIDVSKPWDTKGIEGVHRFLKKLWRLYADEQRGWIVNDDAPTDEELRILHKTIKKISEDIERFAFNTSVSQFMICVNELTSLGCHKRGILEPLALAICPFAPHIAEELWHQLGHTTTVVAAAFPEYEERYTKENSKNYPVAINGKTRLEMEFPLDAQKASIEQTVLADEAVQKYMEGKPVKKFIFVEGKMINVVV